MLNGDGQWGNEVTTQGVLDDGYHPLRLDEAQWSLRRHEQRRTMWLVYREMGGSP
jgi:hypothetical protein